MDAARREKLEATTRWDPAEVETRVFAAWLASGAFHPPAEGTPGRELLDRDPAAERDRRAAHGPRAQRHDPGRADPAQPDAGAQHALAARHRPRQHRRARRGGEGAARRGDLAPGPGPRGVPGAGHGSGGASTGRRSSSSYKRLGASCDYDRERFTLDEGYVRAVYKVFVALYEKGYIYRDNYMVNWDVGSRSVISELEVVQPGRHRHALLDRLPGRGLRRGAHGRHRAPGDDARRHRRRRPPRRRAPPAAWSAGTRSCRSSAAGCRSSPTSTSTPSSAPGR